MTGKNSPRLSARVRQEYGQFMLDMEWLGRVPRHLWLSVALVPCGLVVWQALALILPQGFFAGPGLTIDAFFVMLTDTRREFLIALADTLKIYFAGLAIAAGLGIPLGIALGSWRLLGRATSPFINALAATPIIALTPLIVFLLGLDAPAKILIVAVSALMPVLMNAQLGISRVPPDLIEMARAMNLSPLARLRHISLPAALPSIMAGLRLGAVIGLAATVVGDFYTAMTGLGALLLSYGNSFRMDSYFAIILTYAAIGTATTATLSWLEYKLTPPPARPELAS